MTQYLHCDKHGVLHFRRWEARTLCGLNTLGDREGRVFVLHYDLEVTCINCAILDRPT